VILKNPKASERPFGVCWVNKTPSGTVYTEGFGREEIKHLRVLCTPKGYGETQKRLQDLLEFAE